MFWVMYQPTYQPLPLSFSFALFDSCGWDRSIRCVRSNTFGNGWFIRRLCSPPPPFLPLYCRPFFSSISDPFSVLLFTLLPETLDLNVCFQCALLSNTNHCVTRHVSMCVCATLMDSFIRMSIVSAFKSISVRPDSSLSGNDKKEREKERANLANAYQMATSAKAKSKHTGWHESLCKSSMPSMLSNSRESLPWWLKHVLICSFIHSFIPVFLITYTWSTLSNSLCFHAHSRMFNMCPQTLTWCTGGELISLPNSFQEFFPIALSLSLSLSPSIGFAWPHCSPLTSNNVRIASRRLDRY